MIFSKLLIVFATSVASGAGASDQLAQDSTQQVIELVVARYAEADTSWWAKLGEFALDPFAYAVPTPARGVQVPATPLTRSASHSDRHMAELSRLLGTKGVLDSKDACWPVQPDGCRMGAHHGVVGLSPAMVKGDTASLTLFRIARNVGGRTPTLFSAVQFILVKTGSEWRVASVRIGAG